MRLLITVVSRRRHERTLPQNLEYGTDVLTRIKNLLTGYNHCVYMTKGDRPRVKVIVDASPDDLVASIPELVRPWLELVREQILMTPDFDCSRYKTVVEVDDEHLRQSGYFKTLLDATTHTYSPGDVVALPCEYPREVYDYLFGTLPHLIHHTHGPLINDLYSATKYYDLRFDDFIGDITDILTRLIPPCIGVLDVDTLSGILTVGDKHTSLSDHVTRYISRLCLMCPHQVERAYTLLPAPSRDLLHSRIWSTADNVASLRGAGVDVDFLLRPVPSSPSPSSTSDDPRDRWRSLSHQLFEQMDWSHKVVAGGAPLQCLHPCHAGINTDIDLFVWGTATERRTAIVEVLRTLAMAGRLYLSAKGPVIYVWRDDTERGIQIINGDFRDRLAILMDVDHSCCQVLYDGAQFLGTPAFVESLATNKTRVMNQSFKPDRLQKMIRKGFQYDFREKEEDQYQRYLRSPRSKISGQRYYYPKLTDQLERNDFLLTAVYGLETVYHDVDSLLAVFDFGAVINETATPAPVLLMRAPITDDDDEPSPRPSHRGTSGNYYSDSDAYNDAW